MGLLFVFTLFSNRAEELPSSTTFHSQTKKTASPSAEVSNSTFTPALVGFSQNIGNSSLVVSNDVQKPEHAEKKQQKLSQFVDINSELHQSLLVELHSQFPSEELTMGREGSIEYKGVTYDSYITELGAEFHVFNEVFHRQVSEAEEPYEEIKKELEQELESLGDWNSKNAAVIYQLLDEYNNPDIQLLELNCRSNICLVHFSHPSEHYGVMALGKFMRLIRKKKQECLCKGVLSGKKKLQESTFTFVFD